MKGMSIRGKSDGKYGGVFSLVKPKAVQGKTYKMFILSDIFVIVDNN